MESLGRDCDGLGGRGTGELGAEVFTAFKTLALQAHMFQKRHTW